MLIQMHKLPTGFTMLEMLIALLILSIGLLGVAALQTRGQQFNQIGYVRTQATFLAYDLMDRIRINSDSSNSNSNGDDGAYAINCDSAPSITQDCDVNSATCTPTDLVNYDLFHWCNLIADILPGGEASINWNSTDNKYTINIFWDNILDRNDDAEKGKSPQWELQL